MPRFDGTGPRGQGSFTGGGRGYCVTQANEIGPRFLDRGFFRRGGGRGNRFRYYATVLPGSRSAASNVSQQDEKDILKEQADCLKEELNAVQTRLSSLEKSE